MIKISDNVIDNVIEGHKDRIPIPERENLANINDFFNQILKIILKRRSNFYKELNGFTVYKWELLLKMGASYKIFMFFLGNNRNKLKDQVILQIAGEHFPVQVHHSLLLLSGPYYLL